MQKHTFYQVKRLSLEYTLVSSESNRKFCSEKFICYVKLSTVLSSWQYNFPLISWNDFIFNKCYFLINLESWYNLSLCLTCKLCKKEIILFREDWNYSVTLKK